jgi:hypothetical protein
MSAASTTNAKADEPLHLTPFETGGETGIRRLSQQEMEIVETARQEILTAKAQPRARRGTFDKSMVIGGAISRIHAILRRGDGREAFYRSLPFSRVQAVHYVQIYSFFERCPSETLERLRIEWDVLEFFITATTPLSMRRALLALAPTPEGATTRDMHRLLREPPTEAAILPPSLEVLFAPRLGGAQPPRPRDGAEAEVYRNGAQSTQVADEALQTAARSYRKFVAVLPPSSSRSGGLPGRRSSSQQTTGLHGTIAKVCKSDVEGTFAGTHGNGEVAPIADFSIAR